jgi:hypothetical protein
MGTISIFFVGICTHMHQPEILGGLPGVRHRVVLVNGKVPRKINGAPIPPHRPSLRIAVKDILGTLPPGVPVEDGIAEWELEGTRFSIVGAVGALTYEESYRVGIPHLRLLTKDLPPPDPQVVIDADPSRASCYFDVDAGVFSAGIVGAGAATALLTIDTQDGDPSLRVHHFGKEMPDEYRLRSGAEIAVTNTGLDERGGDDPNDFLLHYETAMPPVPANAGIPTGVAPDARRLRSYVIRTHLDVGPGCSNSNFP